MCIAGSPLSQSRNSVCIYMFIEARVKRGPKQSMYYMLLEAIVHSATKAGPCVHASRSNSAKAQRATKPGYGCTCCYKLLGPQLLGQVA